MRTIERSTTFKRDYKRIKATPRYRKNLDSLLSDLLKFLLANKVLPDKNLDHALSGNWKGYRECHIKPDLLLIYMY
jgi:mRNA interferase YafQ